jgi:arylsulfatase A-like enzyme
MPARTNPNHASLLTGAYPVAHGITGNSYWNRALREPIAKLDDAELLEVETLFTVAEGEHPELVTFAAFGKPKLARLFAGVPGRQRPPDTLWSPTWATAAARDPVTGYTHDSDTMAAALRSMGRDEPDLAVMNLADVDRTAHGHGVDSAECHEAVAEADRAIGRLVEHLKALGRWQHAVLFVTSDHGFQRERVPEAVVELERRLEAEVRGVRFAADGGVGHLYAERLERDATVLGDAAAAVEQAAAIARATPGVAEVLARLPGTTATLLATAHADWRLGHQRVGELLLVAAPGYQFANGADPALPGNHGRPEDSEVPLFVTGGSAAIVSAQGGAEPPAIVDVAPTIASLLGLRLPRRADGTALDAADAGRRFDAILASRHDQSPH